MLPSTAHGNSRLSLWLRVRTYAVPPSMIELAARRRAAGDWAAARAGTGLDLRSVARAHGRTSADRLRADLVVLTDGQTPWPEAQPSCRTVVGLFPRTGGSYDGKDPAYRPDTPPARARVVRIGSAAG